MDGLLKDKVAVITGAGSGVGRAAALIFARHGAKLMLADIGADAVAETVRMVMAEGGIASAQSCDVSDEAAVDALVAAAVASFGRLDIIYNNAGITVQMTADPASRSFLHSKQADTDRLYAVNVGGVINGCKAAIRQFEAQDEQGLGTGGVIVNTASVAGLIGYGSVIYGSTKGAVTIAHPRTGIGGCGEGHPRQFGVSRRNAHQFLPRPQ